MVIDKESVISAGQYPTKLINHMVPEKELYPIHLSVNLTNKCNLSCSYCSNAERDRGWELSAGTLDGALNFLPSIQAVTFTGGGEPTLHPYFINMASMVRAKGCVIALITNGTNKIPAPGIFDWIRISIDGEREALPKPPKDKLVSFSWVWHDGDHKKDTFKQLVGMAKTGEIEHLRIVSNIYRADFERFPHELAGKNIIVQARGEYERGAERCWTGLTWPKMDVDGAFFACCGHQYAFKNAPRKRNMALCLGNIDDYRKRLEEQRPFNGLACDRCYYGQRNRFLDAVKRGPTLKNPEFC